LNAVVDAIANIEEAVVGELGTMNRIAELLCWRFQWVIAGIGESSGLWPYAPQ